MAALAAAVHPAANSFHLSDGGLYAVFNPALANASASPGKRKRGPADRGADAPSSPPHAGAGSGGGDGISATAEAAAEGIHIVTQDGRGPTGGAGRVECASETEIFQALGLSYVPPHLRSWQ